MSITGKIRRYSTSSERVLAYLEEHECFVVGGNSLVGKTSLNKLIKESKVVARRDAADGTVFIKISKPGISPIQFKETIAFFQWLVEQVNRAAGAVGVETVALEIFQANSSTSTFEGDLGAKDASTKLKSSSSEFKRVLVQINTGHHPTPPDLSLLDSKALEILNLELTFRNFGRELVRFMKEGNTFNVRPFQMKLQYRIQTEASGDLSAKWTEVANFKLAKSTSGSMEYYFFIDLGFYASDKLNSIRTERTAEQLGRDVVLIPLFNQFDRLIALHEKRKLDAKASWWFQKIASFSSPYDIVLMGPRRGGKSSVAWAIGDILPNGWTIPFPTTVRPPFSETGATTLVRTSSVPFKKGEMAFTLIDSKGVKFPEDFQAKPHQAVVLVISASIFFDSNWQPKSDLEDISAEIKGSEEALVILLTKFDEVAGPSPASSITALFEDTHALWRGPRRLDYANHMAECCNLVSDRLGKPVFAVQTPVVGDEFVLAGQDLINFQIHWRDVFRDILCLLERSLTKHMRKEDEPWFLQYFTYAGEDMR